MVTRKVAPQQTAATQRAIRRAAEASRRARAAVCNKCGAPIMAGLDDDVCAVVAKVDAFPLSAAGELGALLSGRRTYELIWSSSRGRYEIERRDHFRIAAYPPGAQQNCDVVAQHVCGAFRLETLRTNHLHAQRTQLPHDAPAPF